MSSALPKAIIEAADVSAITQIILRERNRRDLGPWEQMLNCFFTRTRASV